MVKHIVRRTAPTNTFFLVSQHLLVKTLKPKAVGGRYYYAGGGGGGGGGDFQLNVRRARNRSNAGPPIVTILGAAEISK